MDATWGGAGLVGLIGLGVAGHLWAEARGRAAARAALKALASAGFLALAALRFAPGRWPALVLAALALSAVGDLCLLGSRQVLFLGGVGAFLLAHLCYAAAFAPHARPAPAAAAGLVLLAALLLRWLWPHLGALRLPVLAYAAAISLMLLLGLGTPCPRVRIAAALFYASDVLVARDRFVAPGAANRLLGLPLYYAAQVLFAFTVG